MVLESVNFAIPFHSSMIDIDAELTTLWAELYQSVITYVVTNDLLNREIQINSNNIQNIVVDADNCISVSLDDGSVLFVEDLNDTYIYTIYRTLYQL